MIKHHAFSQSLGSQSMLGSLFSPELQTLRDNRLPGNSEVSLGPHAQHVT